MGFHVRRSIYPWILWVHESYWRSKEVPALPGNLAIWRTGSTNEIHGGFLNWWYPTTMGFPTKNDHFRVFWGVPPFKETPTSDFHA